MSAVSPRKVQPDGRAWEVVSVDRFQCCLLLQASQVDTGMRNQSYVVCGEAETGNGFETTSFAHHCAPNTLRVCKCVHDRDLSL